MVDAKDCFFLHLISISYQTNTSIMYIYIDKCESLNSQQCNSSYFIHTKVYERVNDYLNLLKEKHNPTVELFSLSSVFLRFLAVILTFRCDCVCNRRILMTKNCLNVFAHLNRMGNKTQVACLYVIPMSLEMQFTQKLKVYQHPYVVLKLKCFCVYAMKVHGVQNMLFETSMTFNV